MLQPLFDFIDSLATNFSWRKVVILVFIFFIFGLAWFVYESQTSTNQLAKYERTVAILEKISSLDQSNNQSKIVVENIYKGLDSITKPTQYQTSFIDSISHELRQAILAASPWFIFMLFFIPAAIRGEREARNSIWALSFFSILTGGIGYVFPTKWGIWAYPIGGNFLLLIFMAWWGYRIKK